MKETIDIKKVFLYDETCHKKANKQNEKIIKLKIFVSIILIFLFLLYYIIVINNDNSSKVSILIGLILFVSSFIIFLIFIYNIAMLMGNKIDETLFYNRCYILTTNGKFFTFKFNESLDFYKLTNEDLIDILEYFINKSRNNTEILKKNEKRISFYIEEVIECTNIVNVYKIYNQNDSISFVCDFEDLINEFSFKNSKVTIYKYYFDWMEILEYLQNKIYASKEDITYKNGNYNKLVLFIMKMSSININLILLMFFIVYLVIIKNLNTNICIILELLLIIMLSKFYLKRRMIKYTDDDSQKLFLLKSMKIDLIFIVLYSIIFLLFLINNYIHIKELLIYLLIMIFFAILIIYKILKK